MVCDIQMITEVYDSTTNKWIIYNYNENKWDPIDISEVLDIQQKLSKMSNSKKIEDDLDEKKDEYCDDLNSIIYDMELPFYYRNYSIFSKLANVRNYNNINSVSDPRGIPLDSNFCIGSNRRQQETLYCNPCKLELQNFHSHTFFTLSELQLIDWSNIKDYNKYIGTFMKQLNKLSEYINEKNPSNIRVLMYFDN